MLRIFCLFGLLVGLTGSATAADPTLKKVIPTDAVVFARAFSEDSKVCTLIFDNLLIDTDIGKGGLPSVETKNFTYVFTPESDGEVCVVQIIRGFVSTQNTGSAALQIHSNGQTTAVDFDKAIATAKKGLTIRDPDLLKKAKGMAADQGFKGKPKRDKFDDFQIKFERHVAKGVPLQTTLSLLVDRLPAEDGNSGAALYVDTIDVEVLPVVKKK